MRTEHHDHTGHALVQVANPGGNITLNADDHSDRAVVTLVPVAEGDEAAADRIRRATIRSNDDRITVELPEMPTTVVGGGTSTVIQTSGGQTVINQNIGTVARGNTVIGMQMGAGSVISGGDLHFSGRGTQTGGTTVVQTGGGAVNVSVHAPAGSSLVARSQGGSIAQAGTAERIDADTSGGSIHVAHATGELELNTSAGSIVLGTIEGRVDARTSAGNIRAAELQRGGNLRTSAGSIRAHLSGNHRLSVRTSAAGIDLTTAAGVSDTHLSWRTSAGQARVNGQPRDTKSKF